jgi:hypothetical protein
MTPSRVQNKEHMVMALENVVLKCFWIETVGNNIGLEEKIRKLGTL